MKGNPVEWAIGKLVTAQIRHPLLVFFIALALSTAAVTYTVGNLGVQTSQKDLISPGDRLIRLAQQVSQFEQLDSFIVVIESKDPQRSLQFLNALAPLLEQNRDDFRQVFYRVDPELLKKWALLYLDKKEITDIVDNLRENRPFLHDFAKQPTLVNFFNKINQEMSEGIVGEIFTGFLKEPSEKKQPLDLEFLIRILSEMRRYIEQERFMSPWDSLITTKSLDITQEGYFWTRDKQYLLLFVTPVKKEEFAGTLESIRRLREYVAQARAEFPEVNAGVTGPEALNVDQMSTALHDMELATIMAMFGLTVLFIIFRKSIRRPLFESITLIMALSWSFGLTTLFIGHLNILSVTFAPLLLGLGIDFGAHWFARYQEEEGKFHDSKQTLVRVTMEKIGPGILLAGSILAFSFLPLTITGFKGLVELGFICFTGMIVMTIASLFVLPVLILLFDRPKLKRSDVPRDGQVEPFMNLPKGRIAAIIIICGIATALAAWNATEVRFDLNMLNLQSPKVESVVWEHKLLESSGLSSIFGQMLSPSLEDVRSKSLQLEGLPSVARVESVLDLLPSDQEEKLLILQRLKPVLAGIDLSKTDLKPVNMEALDEVLGRIRFKMLDSSSPDVSERLKKQMIEVRKLIETIRKEIKSDRTIARKLGSFQYNLIQDLNDKLKTVRDNVNASPMKVDNLPPPLLERFMTSDNRFLIRVFPEGDIWSPAVLGRFVHDLRSIDPDVVGDPVTLYVFTKEFRDSTVEAAFYSVILMFLFLLIIFRELKSTFLALIPLLVGTMWIFGLMPLLGIKLNLANSIFLPLIVGAGVEYGVIIISRWHQREEDKPKNIVLPGSTAWGVILAGLSTTVGFGCLMISSHQGIFSLGLLSAIGSLVILAAAVIFLPAILEISEKEKGKRKGD